MADRIKHEAVSWRWV